MPLPLYYGCILREAVDRVSWPKDFHWSTLTREQQGELTKGQVRKMQASLNHKPVYAEHPDEGRKVKVGEVVHNYLTDDDAWYVVMEINDGHPAGVDLLTRIKNNELTGLSLGHDTWTNEPEEVSVVKKGFRLGTGIEGEMDNTIRDFGKTNMQEYKDDETFPNSSTIPRHINASLFAMSQNATGFIPPPGNLLPGVQYPANTTPTYPTQQQPASTTSVLPPPPSNTTPSNTTDVIHKSPDHQAVERLMQSNIPSAQKTEVMQLINSLTQDKRKLEAKVEMQGKNDAQTIKYYQHLLNTFLAQTSDTPVENTTEQDQVLALENPVQFAQAMIPRIQKASARYNELRNKNGFTTTNNNNNTSSSSSSSGEYNPHHVSSPIDDALNAQYQMFIQAASGNAGVGNYSMPSASFQHHHQQQPRHMQASNHRNNDDNNKRTRNSYENYGAGGWTNDPQLNLMPETRQIMRETQSAATGGFGDSVRLGDVHSSKVTRQYVPDESQLVQMRPGY